MKYLFLSIAFCVSFQVATYAQSKSLNPTFDNIFPPSPNAAALGKFGSSPVGLSTGVPEVKVPIFTWEGKGFGRSVSISLDYHAGGIQVDQMASNVGLGWALNAGGVISRAMRGIQDEASDYGFLYKAPPISEYAGNSPVDYQAEDRVFNRMYTGKLDSQNDLFSFNFNGRSGRFVLGRNNDLLLLDQSKLKIEKFIQDPNSFNSARIARFVITDEFGYKYEFADYELTMTSIVSLPPPHTSSWYLSKITNPSGTDSIVFEYEDYLLNVIQTGRTQSLAIPLTLDGTSHTANLGGSSAQTVDGKRIKKITFTDNTIVSFKYSQAVRTDLQGGSTDKALEQILIQNSNKSYGYLLKQNYSLGGRLTLLSVQQHGSTEQETIKPYEFIYSTTLLPDRFSSRKDHWGYPNINPSESLIPKEYLIVGGENGPYAPYKEFLGGNRDTDPNLVKAGSLTKMIYPTGGYTEFEMEANTAVDAWLNKAVVAQVPNPYTEYSSNEPITSNTNPGGTSSFTFQGENNTSTFFELSVNPYIQNCSSCGVKFELYNSSGGLMSTQTIPYPSPNANRQILSFGIVNLTKGATYTFKMYAIGLSNYYDYVEIRRKETNPPGTTKDASFGSNQLYVGGLRVKKITDYSATGLVASSREYEYVLENGTTSSGSLGYRPIYSYFTKYDFIVTNNNSNLLYYVFHPHADYVIRSSSSVNEIPMVNGSPVTYKRVIEKNGQNGVYLGKTVRTFGTFADSPPFISADFPTIPAQYASWNYGQLKSEEIYDADNSLLKKTENLYFNFTDGYSGDQTRVENFRSISFAPASFSWPSAANPEIHPDNYPGYFLMKNFTPVSGRAELSQSTVTDYVGGIATTKVITNYDYDPNYFYVKEERTTDSKNIITKKTFQYPKDMVDANQDATIYNGMLGINMINPVIEETQFVGATQTFATKTKYKNWSGTLFAPELVSTKTLANDPEIRLRYLQYNTNGTPASFQKEKGVVINYFWSYKKQYPIAEIKNGDYAAIVTALGGATLVNDFGNGFPVNKAAVDTFLAPIRNNTTTFKDAHVTSYSYEPLGGITSTTDPKGMTTYYEYDEFQRLKSIKDQDGNIVKTYDYYFKP